MIFPTFLTWAEIAKQPFSTECFEWSDEFISEDTPNFAAYIEQYSTAFTSSPKLTEYLDSIGYSLAKADDGTFIGIAVRNEAAIKTAHALFEQISAEYDDYEMPKLRVMRHGHEWLQTPTWAMFELGGDDDVDYCGGQPSCLTALLLTLVDLGRH